MIMIGKQMTIASAAEKLGVTRQRMHQLIQEHSLKTELVHARLRLIHPRELAKIPEIRTPGKKSSKKPPQSLDL